MSFRVLGGLLESAILVFIGIVVVTLLTRSHASLMPVRTLAAQVWTRADDPQAPGVRHGAFTATDSTTGEKVEGTYVDGLPQGEWLWSYPNGKTKLAGRIHSGARSGEWKYFDAEGMMLVRGAYENGRANGEWTWWHPTGVRARVGQFVNGVPLQDTWRSWNLDGSEVRALSAAPGERSGG